MKEVTPENVEEQEISAEKGIVSGAEADQEMPRRVLTGTGGVGDPEVGPMTALTGQAVKGEAWGMHLHLRLLLWFPSSAGKLSEGDVRKEKSSAHDQEQKARLDRLAAWKQQQFSSAHEPEPAKRESPDNAPAVW
jgi:hypothetical protein